MQTKIALRQQLRAKLAELTLAYRAQSAIAAPHLFSQEYLFTEATNIATYAARDHEFNCQPLQQLLWQNNKNCFLPVMTLQKTLNFYPFFPTTQLKPNRWGILEPESVAPTAEMLDVIIMPLIAFDQFGGRLGSGGGYYDRSLAKLSKSAKKPFLIGLGFDCQEHEKIPTDEWDITLDAVLTETRFIICK